MDKQFDILTLPTKCRVKLMMYNEEPKFSDGVITLVELVDKLGSLNKACKSMGMAYSKGIKVIRQTEAEVGFKLIDPKIGGSNGGGSTITEEGAAFVKFYRRLTDLVEEFALSKMRSKDV